MDKRVGKLIGIVVGVVALIVMISAVFIVLDVRRSATLDITVAPISAEVLVNGKRYSNGIHRLEPGQVAVEISREGFVPQSGTLELKEGETTKLYTYLVPESGGMEWYLEHEEDQMILNTIGDARAGVESKDYRAENPIVAILPIIYANYDADWEYTEFRVDGGKFGECRRDFCVKITDTTGGNYERALGVIRERGFDPGEYEIVYVYEPIVPLE